MSAGIDPTTDPAPLLTFCSQGAGRENQLYLLPSWESLQTRKA